MRERKRFHGSREKKSSLDLERERDRQTDRQTHRDRERERASMGRERVIPWAQRERIFPGLKEREREIE